MQMGLDGADWEGKPVIAVINTWSDLLPAITTCGSGGVREEGVYQAGGMPVEMPVHSFSEQPKPTSMLTATWGRWRSKKPCARIRSMGVLLGGCDKSTPALIMGAVSMDTFIFMPAGAMLVETMGQKLGSGTDVWKYDERRAGTITKEQWDGVQGGIARSYGTCMTMGTASTMMTIADGWA